MTLDRGWEMVQDITAHAPLDTVTTPSVQVGSSQPVGGQVTRVGEGWASGHTLTPFPGLGQVTRPQGQGSCGGC